tara:strand:- start:889 stop:3435 length:2547 start_codon:yes stop_codon:yes gene_type:complete
MDIKLKKYTRDLLKGYCGAAQKTQQFNDTERLIDIYSVNVLADADAKSVMDCDIQSPSKINIRTPIDYSTESYERLLGDILLAECTLLSATPSISPLTRLLITTCHERLLDYSYGSPIVAIKGNFLVRALDIGGAINIEMSVLQSFRQYLATIFSEHVALRLCKSIADFQLLFTSAIQAPASGEYTLDEFKIDSIEGPLRCITDKDKIVSDALFINEVLTSVAAVYPSVNLILNDTFKINIFAYIKPLAGGDFTYMRNIGDGDCLFVAAAKYLHILSDTNRLFPDDSTLRRHGKTLRFLTAQYIYNNRHVVYTDQTFEGMTEALYYVNVAKFNSFMNTLQEQEKKSLFKNPTHMETERIFERYNDRNLDDFTKYCILMANHVSLHDGLLQRGSIPFTLSEYGGYCEVIALGKVLQRDLFVVNSNYNRANAGSFKYYFSLKQKSITLMDSQRFPMFLYLRGSRSVARASSDHYELIWPRTFQSNSKIVYPAPLSPPEESLYYVDDRDIRVARFIHPTKTTLSTLTQSYFDMEEYISSFDDTNITEDLPTCLTQQLVSDDDIHYDKEYYTIGAYEYAISYLATAISSSYSEKTRLETLKQLASHIGSIVNIDEPIRIFRDGETIMYDNFESDVGGIDKRFDARDIRTPYETEEEESEDSSDALISELWSSQQYVLINGVFYKKQYITQPLISHFPPVQLTKKKITSVVEQNIKSPFIDIVSNLTSTDQYTYQPFTKKTLPKLRRLMEDHTIVPLHSSTFATFATKNRMDLSDDSSDDSLSAPINLLTAACLGKSAAKNGLNIGEFKKALIEYIGSNSGLTGTELEARVGRIKKMSRRQLHSYCEKIGILE